MSYSNFSRCVKVFAQAELKETIQFHGEGIIKQEKQRIRNEKLYKEE